MNSNFSTKCIINRQNGEAFKEKVYFEGIIRFFYGKNRLGRWLAHITATFPLFSRFFGFLQKQPFSKRKIAPFIKKYGVDTSEFLNSVDTFDSFNDFFIRKLKSEARPLATTEAIIPADGRFLFYQDSEACDGFVIKGEKFSLATLLGSKALAKEYLGASMVIGRLCPTDYHRFHFPCSNTPSMPRIINGPLYSVNPIALRHNLQNFAKNKRCITTLDSPHFGEVILIEVGAANVGTIQQTYQPEKKYQKGDEKGYFSFGGSAIVLLFQKNKIIFENDLKKNSEQHIETLCLMGQSLGVTKK